MDTWINDPKITETSQKLKSIMSTHKVIVPYSGTLVSATQNYAFMRSNSNLEETRAAHPDPDSDFATHDETTRRCSQLNAQLDNMNEAVSVVAAPTVDDAGRPTPREGEE